MFDEEFLTPEIEKRYEKLTEEQQKEFFKYFETEGPKKLEDIGLEDIDLEDANLNKIFIDLAEEAFIHVGEKKDDWRGLPLLW